MKLLVNELSVINGGYPRLGTRFYLELDVHMSKEFMYENIVNMLGKMTEQDISHMLKEEFKLEVK